MHVITPAFKFHGPRRGPAGRSSVDGFRYSSDANMPWLSGPELLHLAEIPHEPAAAEAVVLQ